MSTNVPDINAPQDLSDDPRPTDFNNMAEQRGTQQPMLQPGVYVFQLPDPIVDSQFEQFQVPDQGPTLRANFRDDKALKNLTNGDTFGTQLNNMTVTRGKKGEEKTGDDLAYLIKAVGGTLPPKAGNKTYRDELKKHGGKKFKSDVVISARCNPKSEVYKEGQKIAGRLGCGQKFDMRAYSIKSGANAGKQVLAIQRDQAGVWAEGVECPCGAEVRAFANLTNFRPAE